MGCAVCKTVQTSTPDVTPPEGAKNSRLGSVEPHVGLPKAIDGGEKSGSTFTTSPFSNTATDYSIPLAATPTGEVNSANKDEAVDAAAAKAPSYRVRRSIMTARVKFGETHKIFQKYIVTDDVLGTGISGAVRVAVDRTTGKPYAVKTLSLENISPKKAAMLHNEVDIYLKLDHPNIAKLIEVYEDSKRIFLVMELCTGRELYDRLAAKKRYSEGDAIKVAQQMLEAINYCHKHRICHRDLKLENWVYASESEDAALKLIDFGFSRIFNPVIPMTAMHGTVYYVSPEVMDGCYREKCDIWSIGVIVYMLLSGTPPFNGAVDYQILLKIKTANYNFDAPIWSSISADAKNFIRALLVRDPDARPSAEEALKLPWLQNRDDKENLEINVDVLQAMRSFALGNAMKRAALSLVAYSLTNDEVQDLYKEFKKLDKDRTGTIRLQDLVSALTEHLKMTDYEAARVFERIDQTGDREVHYTEFLASTLHAKLLADGAWMREAFNRLDHDGDGFIGLEDLKQVLGDSFNNTRVEEILEMCDSDKKGCLNFDDFRDVLSSTEGFQVAEAVQPRSVLENRTSFSDAVVSLSLTRRTDSVTRLLP